MADSPGGDTLIAAPGGLVPRIAVLHRQYVALGHSCVGTSQRSAHVVHEAVDTRARSQRLRDQTAQGRADRHLEHGGHHRGVGELLREVISGAPALEPPW